MILIISLALVALVGLSGYAFYLYLQLRKLKSTKNARDKLLAEEQEERKNHYHNSIRVIASAIEADQVTLTEGAIRISMMATQLDLPEHERQHFQVFFQLTEATAHIPILDEWQKLSTREKLRYDREREEIETKYREFAVSAARILLNKKPDQNQETLFYPVGKH
ncbi:DUF2489 domain-containing protein [Porticoccus sp.]|uniref:DUF2489 domain-containing protein n=1 Tax=Porticoccus sp. TaxID=2024853 RepID=UPI003F699E97